MQYARSLLQRIISAYPRRMMSESEREQKRTNHRMLTDYTIGRVEGETPRHAALAAGYTPSQASQAKRTLEPRVRSTIREYLDENGATRQDVAAAIGRALVAVKPSKHGTYEDSATQLAAGRFVAELHGETKAQSVGSSISVTLSGPLAEAFMQRMQGNAGIFAGTSDDANSQVIDVA